MRILLILSVLVCGVFTASSVVNAQISMGTMVLSMDDDSQQEMKDLLARRVSISPLNHSIDKKTRKLMLEFHNPSDDTLEMEIKLSNSVPEATIPMNQTDSSKKPVKSLLSADDDSGSIYKPMGKWITNYPKKLILAPGEKKELEFEVSIPDSLMKGEYVCWIVAEVAPRKSLLAKAKKNMNNSNDSKRIVNPSITVSSSKVTYNNTDDANKSMSDR